jgi:outer membrane immunogenic protein
MKNCALALLCSVALVQAANAADLGPVVKAPLVAPAPLTWTGFYIGGNVGWAHSRYSASNVTGSESAIASLAGVPIIDLGSGTAGFPGADVGNDSAAAGAQIGFNYQIGRAVLGLEADIQATDLNGRLNNNGTFSLSGIGLPADLNSQISMRTDWYATMRGRLGYSFGSLMPYVTGGLAITQVKATITNSGSVPGIASFSSASDSISKTLTGYAIGAGLEYALGGGWSIKGEYLHLGFGNQSYDLNTPYSSTPVPLVLSGTMAAHADVKTDFDIARVGVNYRF